MVQTYSSLEELGKDLEAKNPYPSDEEYVSLTVKNTVHIPEPLGVIICVVAGVVLLIVLGAAILWCRRKVLES